MADPHTEQIRRERELIESEGVNRRTARGMIAEKKEQARKDFIAAALAKAEPSAAKPGPKLGGSGNMQVMSGAGIVAHSDGQNIAIRAKDDGGPASKPASPDQEQGGGGGEAVSAILTVAGTAYTYQLLFTGTPEEVE